MSGHRSSGWPARAADSAGKYSGAARPGAGRFQAADPDQYETVNIALDLLSPMVRPTDYSPALWNLTGLLYTAAAGDSPGAAANVYCALRRYPADPLSPIRSFPQVAHAAALADCRAAQADLLFDVRLAAGASDPAAAGGGSPVRAVAQNGTVAAAFAGDKLACFTVSDNQAGRAPARAPTQHGDSARGRSIGPTVRPSFRGSSGEESAPRGAAALSLRLRGCVGSSKPSPRRPRSPASVRLPRGGSSVRGQCAPVRGALSIFGRRTPPSPPGRLDGDHRFTRAGGAGGAWPWQMAVWGRGLNNAYTRCHVVRFRGPPVFTLTPSTPLDSPVAGAGADGLGAGAPTLPLLVARPVRLTFRARDPNPEDAVAVLFLSDPGLPDGAVAGESRCVDRGAVPNLWPGSPAIPKVVSLCGGGGGGAAALCAALPSPCAEAANTLDWAPAPGQEGRSYRVCAVARDDKTYCALRFARADPRCGPRPADYSCALPPLVGASERSTTHGFYGAPQCAIIQASERGRVRAIAAARQHPG